MWKSYFMRDFAEEVDTVKGEHYRSGYKECVLDPYWDSTLICANAVRSHPFVFSRSRKEARLAKKGGAAKVNSSPIPLAHALIQRFVLILGNYGQTSIEKDDSSRSDGERIDRDSSTTNSACFTFLADSIEGFGLLPHLPIVFCASLRQTGIC